MLIAHPRKGAEGRKIENVWRPPGYPVASASVRSADAKTREEITEMAVAADTNCGESKGGEGGNILARGGGNMHFSPPAPPWAFGHRIRSADGRVASSGLGTNSFPAAEASTRLDADDGEDDGVIWGYVLASLFKRSASHAAFIFASCSRWIV